LLAAICGLITYCVTCARLGPRKMLAGPGITRSAEALDLMKYFGACRLDTLNQCLWRDDALLALPPRPYAVLRYLVEHPDRLITQNEFMEALWPGTYVQPQVLRTYVLELRKLLGDDAANPRFIATVPKRGYRFLAPVTDAALHGSRVADAGQPGAGAVSQASETIGRDVIGRQGELAKLDGLMLRACGGERQVVFISGEPGVGKTALVDAFCVGGCGDARVGRGQSVEHFGNKEAYSPVKEIVRDLASSLCGPDKGDKTLRLLARIAPGWNGSVAGAGVEGKGSGGATAGLVAASGPKATGAGTKAAGGPNAGAAVVAAVTPSAVAEQVPGDICDTLEAMAQETPLLLVFEDLHWADDATLDLFSALARRRGYARLMMIATCRPSAGRAVSPRGDDEGNGGSARVRESGGSGAPTLRTLKQDLVRRRLCAMIQLEPLGRDAVREYVERELVARRSAGVAAGGAKANGVRSTGQKSQDEVVPAGLIGFLYEQSNGNPLFFSAMLDHLIAERVLVAGGGGWVLRGPLNASDIGVPENLREMIELEAESLSAPDQRLLEAASVAGVVFPVWAAAAVLSADAGDDLTEVEEQYEGLSRRVHFIRGAGHDELPDGARSTSYVFAHPYYREVLYHRQPEVRRSRGHQRVAERLGVIFAGDENSVAAEVAGHYEAAGNWKSAAQTLARMAAVAVEAQQRESAASLLERALELLGNLGVRERGILEAELRERLGGLAAGPLNTSAKAAAGGAANAPAPAPAPSRTKKIAGPLKKNGTQKKLRSSAAGR
jgi:DNA-binding winged helix-turn-helix (wHTH) protein